MQILWEDRAWDDYLYWQTQDKKTLKRINALINDIKRNPFDGIGRIDDYSTKVHGLKSSVKVIGARELSEKTMTLII